MSASVRRNLEQRIEHELASEARLAAELLAHRTTASEAELDAEADALGPLLSARVTFIAADGRVVGDSDLTAEELARGRESRRAPGDRRRAGERDAAARGAHSATIDSRHAVRRHSGAAIRECRCLSIVRLALPLTDVDRQLAVGADAGARWASRRAASPALRPGLGRSRRRSAGASARSQQRVERYASGDLSRPAPDYGDDELGTVARLLDGWRRTLRQRLAGLEPIARAWKRSSPA